MNSPTLFDFTLDHQEAPTTRQIAVRAGSRLLLLLTVLLGLAYIGRAQEAPTITDKDIVVLSPAQVEALQAYQAFQPLRDAAAADLDKRLQATKEFKRWQEANAALERAAEKVYAAHGLKPADDFICYGPTAEGPCKGAPEKKYVFRKVKAEAAKANEAPAVVQKEVAKK